MSERQESAQKSIRDIRRATRRQSNADEKIRIMPFQLKTESKLTSHFLNFM